MRSPALRRWRADRRVPRRSLWLALPALAVALGAGAAETPGAPETSISASTYPSGSPSVRIGLITSDGPVIARSRTYGCEADAVTLAALANAGPRSASREALQGDSIEVMGGLCAGSFNHTYAGLDSVATYFSNRAPAPIAVDRNARFDATHVYFSTPLTPLQVAAVAPGMVVRTNPLPVAAGGARSPFQSVIASVSADGRMLTVRQWAQPGDPTGASVGRSPQAYGGSSGPYTAIVDLVLNVYGNDTLVSLAPGSGQDYADLQNDEERAEIGDEVAMDNGYALSRGRARGLVDPYFDVPLDVGIHVTANGDGSVGFSADTGADANPQGGQRPTAFDYGFTARGARFAGFDAVPVGAVNPRYGFLAETLPAATQWAFAYVPQLYGHPGTLKWGVAADGTNWATGLELTDGSASAAGQDALGSIRPAEGAAIRYAAVAHEFADPTGADRLRIAASPAGVTLGSNRAAITTTVPLIAAAGVRLPVAPARGLPSDCVTGALAYGRGIRLGDQTAGAGSGAPVYCDDARRWIVLATGRSPTY